MDIHLAISTSLKWTGIEARMHLLFHILQREARMGRKRSIVIVDDDVDASQMEKVILEKTGLYDVMVCNQGSEALEVIRNLQPDLVLLDIVMPDADGAEIAAEIREDKSLASTQVVFMTSLISEQEMAQSSRAGGYPFIPKPVSSETLLKRVKGFFSFGN